MSANIVQGRLLTFHLGELAREMSAQVLGVIFEGTSRHVASGKAERWRELMIARTSAGIVLRDRVRENRDSRDRTISCDWQLFENVARCINWLRPDNKLESRARSRLIDMLPPAQA